MISNHEFVVAVRDDIYPQVRELEEKLLKLFVSHVGLRGPTAMPGDANNEVAYTIRYLNSSIAFLKRLAKEHNIPISQTDRSKP